MNADFTTVEEVAIGAAESVAEVATNPVGTARKQMKGLERRGTPAVRKLNRRINGMIPDRLTILGVEVNGKLPEKFASKGIQLVKVQARRPDVVGDVAKRTLRIFNRSFKIIARTATRFEQASELTSQRESTATATRARRPRRRTA